MIIKKNQAAASLRRIYGTIVGTDGITRVASKGGSAARKIVNGLDSGNWTATLTHIGNGEYYVELTQAETDVTEGDVLSWGFKAADTAEAVVDRAQILSKLPSDALTLTADYDAAKTAASSTALTTHDTDMKARLDHATYGLSALQTSLASVIARIGAFTGTGVNTILGFFKALLSKTATLPSDIGGTFDPAADSVEAISEVVATRASQATLLSSVEGGTVLIPGASDDGDVVTLHKKNSYSGLAFTLGTSWASILTGNKVYLAAKKRYSDSTYLFNIEGTVIDAVNAVVSFDLTPTDTDHDVFSDYKLEVQVRSSDNLVIKSAIIRRLELRGIVRS